MREHWIFFLFKEKRTDICLFVEQTGRHSTVLTAPVKILARVCRLTAHPRRESGQFSTRSGSKQCDTFSRNVSAKDRNENVPRAGAICCIFFSLAAALRLSLFLISDSDGKRWAAADPHWFLRRFLSLRPIAVSNGLAPKTTTSNNGNSKANNNNGSIGGSRNERVCSLRFPISKERRRGFDPRTTISEANASWSTSGKENERETQVSPEWSG